MNTESLKDKEVKAQTTNEIIGMDSLLTNEIQSESSEQDIKLNKEDQTVTIKLFRKWKIRIYKPLISLKLALFIYYGGGSIVGPFLIVFLKQRGMTLQEVSMLYIITPIVQTFGPVIAGIIADKIGRSKPVLVGNILFVLVTIVSILLLPPLHKDYCDPQSIKMSCTETTYRLETNSPCSFTVNTLQLHLCKTHCQENATYKCLENNLICESHLSTNNANFSVTVNVNVSHKFEGKCYYDASSVLFNNLSYSRCHIYDNMNCEIICTLLPTEDCSVNSSYRTKLLVVYFTILVIFYTFFSNSYRFMDVTSMALVKEHHSEYGRERFFAILGMLVLSPFGGYVVEATTNVGEEKNYNSAFYIFIAMLLITLVTIYKVKVQIKAPSEQMWKKTLAMAKNPDIVSFAVIVFILGSSWGFTKLYMFWYLEELNAPSVLLGLLPAIGGLYGLPFLLTSKWWVDKIGSTNIFLLGFIGYVISAVGYSFLYNPWLSLLLEATSILTYHLLWVAVIQNSHDIAPEGMTATVIASAGGIHYSIGKASGSLISGLIMNVYGGRVAFRAVAVICFVSFLLYGLYLYIRHRYLLKKMAKTNKNIS